MGVLCFGFVAGLVAGLLCPWGQFLLAPMLASLAWTWWKRHDWYGPLLLAAAVGVMWGDLARHARARDCRIAWHDGEHVTAMVEPIERAGAEADSRLRRFTVIDPARCAGPVLVLLPAPDSGNAVRAVVGTWRRDPDFGKAPLPRRPERAGRIVARIARPLDTAHRVASSLRMAAESKLVTLFGASRWPLAAALTVTAEAELPREVRQRFARSGLAHILSISGFHVGILAGVIMLLLRALRLAPDPARIAGTALVVLYVWMLGAPAPALRSALLLALWCWARVRQRPPLTVALLASTALVITAVDPWTVFEAGPWLSFAGVWGCTAASRWWTRVVKECHGRERRRLLRWCAPVAVSLGAVLATTPIQLVAFGTASPVAIATNLVAVPLAAFAVPAIALSLAVACLPVHGAIAVAATPAAAAGLSLDALDAVSSWGARQDWGTFSPEPALVFAVLSLAVCAFLLRPGPRRRPARDVLRSRALIAAAGAAVFACWSPVIAGAGGTDADGRLTLHLLAVGQGDAAAIRTPHGSWIVIDGGPRLAGIDAGARRVVPFLQRQRARRIALLVASHGDADHMGGLPAVLEALPVDVAMEPGVALGRPLYLDWMTDIAKDRARWHPARAGDRIVIDGVTLRVWHPDSATIAQHWEPNENSVVLTIELGDFRAVFGGDAGLPMEALRAGQIGPVTVLKVGHHGSRTASSQAWIDALRPRLCVIEVGRNTYGHPNPDTVARLTRSGCNVYRTDRDGDVRIATDGRSVEVRAAARDTSFIVSKEQP